MADETATAPSTVNQSDRIAQAASVAGAATLTSRILGLVREQVLAALFGAGNEMDAYLVAFRIPELLYAICSQKAR